MKKSIVLLPFAFMAFCVQAKMITVNNNPNSAGMYTTAQAAHDAANVGDTLLIQASLTSYGTLNLVKRLIVIGEGHTNVRGISGNASKLDYIYVDSSTTAPPPVVSGARLIGLYTVYDISLHNTSGGFANNVIVERCRINGTMTVYGNNWNIRNCVISGYNLAFGSTSTGAIVSNNILNYISSNNSGTPRNIVIQNNLFLSSYYQFLQSLNTCTLLNNIFYSGPTSGTAIVINYSTTNLVFTSNLNAEASTSITLPGTGNSGTNNLNNQLPIFTETISSFSGIGNWNSYKWMLSSTSPGHNYGTDGKDVGIYGGLYPWTAAMFIGDPGLPYVVSIDVQNAVVKPGDKVKFNVKAKSFGY